MKQLVGILLGMTLLVSNAKALDIGIGVKAGTVGAGVDLSVALTRTINARISLTGVDIEDETESITVGDPGFEGDIDSVLSLDFGASALLFDWYVFNGTFHVTAGFLKNNGAADLSGILQSAVVLDGLLLDPSDINGAITGSVSAAESYEPYIGIGWGRKAGADAGISLSIELGIALMDPKTDLNATVSGSSGYSQSELDSILDSAANDANDDLSDLEAWPILSIGLNYAF